MIMRPDEEANRAEIERDQQFRKNIRSGLSTGAALGSTAVGAGIAGRIMPFLSKYVPVDLAVKGISKISPKVGDFLKRGQSMGLNVEEGLEYLKEQIAPKQEPPKEKRNIIEQYSPELHQFIDQEIKKGRTSLEAGALAQNDKRFKSTIDKLSKDHKTPWSNILESVYGSQQGSAQNPQQPQQQQPGQGQAALMAILQKIQQARGGQ